LKFKNIYDLSLWSSWEKTHLEPGHARQRPDGGEAAGRGGRMVCEELPTNPLRDLLAWDPKLGWLGWPAPMAGV